jgi:hypothetical protein
MRGSLPASLCIATMRRVASTPSMTGISLSMNTQSKAEASTRLPSSDSPSDLVKMSTAS